MTGLYDIVAEVKDLPEVYSVNVWKDRRVYVNITGRNTKFRGDYNTKVYYDGKMQKWIIEGMKGTFSSDFWRNIQAFAETRCRHYFHKDC